MGFEYNGIEYDSVESALKAAEAKGRSEVRQNGPESGSIVLRWNKNRDIWFGISGLESPNSGNVTLEALRAMYSPENVKRVQAALKDPKSIPISKTAAKSGNPY